MARLRVGSGTEKLSDSPKTGDAVIAINTYFLSAARQLGKKGEWYQITALEYEVGTVADAVNKVVLALFKVDANPPVSTIVRLIDKTVEESPTPINTVRKLPTKLNALVSGDDWIMAGLNNNSGTARVAMAGSQPNVNSRFAVTYDADPGVGISTVTWITNVLHATIRIYSRRIL